MIVNRILKKEIDRYFNNIPITAIIGARQVGKSTLAKEILKTKRSIVYLDIEKQSDKQKLTDPEAFFLMNRSKIICIDEIQFMPNLLNELRSFVDNHQNTKFIILGSSSPELIRYTSETLAGRVFYYELSPFLWPEISSIVDFNTYRLRGGMPLSLLADEDNFAFIWLHNYIKTFLERDLRMFGYNIPPEALKRLWKMLAHLNGQVLNYSLLANSMGLSQPTVRRYIEILQQSFMLRIIPSYYINSKRRLIKSPKLYFRDVGILHTLLSIESFDQLFSHPVFGSSWEVVVIENIINRFNNWQYFYYRTSKGAEIDLVLVNSNRVVAIEIKASTAPRVSRGFWTALEDIGANKSYIIAPVETAFPYKNSVMVYPLTEFLELDEL
jgi:predicted AAA+ superfamily ATPase